MSSIIKVDTIQNQSGANIISESANTITVGASGDTVTIPSGGTLGGAGTFDLSSGSVTLNSTMKNTPAFSARETSQQTISHNTVTNLTFGTEEIDTDSAFASNVFTVPSGAAGKYYLFAQINLYDADSNISGCQLWIWKGTNATKLSNLYNTTGGGENRSHVNNNVAVIADLSAGDVIGAAVNMTTTDSGTVTSYGGDNGTRILGYKLIGA